MGRARPRSSLRPTRREIMFSFFAVLIYSAQPRKLKLKGLHADVKRHFCSTINLNYLMFYTHGQRDFLTLYLNSIWHLRPLTFFLTLLRPRIDKFNFYRIDEMPKQGVFLKGIICGIVISCIPKNSLYRERRKAFFAVQT